MRVTRRDWLRAMVGGAAVALTPELARAAALHIQKPVKITVYKSPTCGCCKAWVDHVRAAGFDVATHDLGSEAPLPRSSLCVSELSVANGRFDLFAVGIVDVGHPLSSGVVRQGGST